MTRSHYLLLVYHFQALQTRREVSQRRFPDEYPNAQYADADTGQSDRIDKARRAHSILYLLNIYSSSLYSC